MTDDVKELVKCLNQTSFSRAIVGEPQGVLFDGDSIAFAVLLLVPGISSGHCSCSLAISREALHSVVAVAWLERRIRESVEQAILWQLAGEQFDRMSSFANEDDPAKAAFISGAEYGSGVFKDKVSGIIRGMTS